MNKYKVYCFEESENGKPNYAGVEGLMVSSNKNSVDNAKKGQYASAGYTTGTDSVGSYIKTYFNDDNGKTYVITDYGNGNTILNNYVGSTSASVKNAYTGKDSTVADLAAARTKVITGK